MVFFVAKLKKYSNKLPKDLKKENNQEEMDEVPQEEVIEEKPKKKLRLRKRPVHLDLSQNTDLLEPNPEKGISTVKKESRNKRKKKEKK